MKIKQNNRFIKEEERKKDNWISISALGHVAGLKMHEHHSELSDDNSLVKSVKHFDKSNRSLDTTDFTTKYYLLMGSSMFDVSNHSNDIR